MEHFLKIPQDRIGAMIGPAGKVKRDIEKKTGIKVDVDSETGEVTIHYDNVKDPVMVLKINDFIRAVGRGFSPERAYRLLKEDQYFAVMDIQDYVGKKMDHVRRMRARVIGSSRLGGGTMNFFDSHTCPWPSSFSPWQGRHTFSYVSLPRAIAAADESAGTLYVRSNCSTLRSTSRPSTGTLELSGARYHPRCCSSATLVRISRIRW